jgi:hypothetical protein
MKNNRLRTDNKLLWHWYSPSRQYTWEGNKDLQRKDTYNIQHTHEGYPDVKTYALKASIDSENYTPTSDHDKCPMSRFGTTTNVPSIQNHHHCGYPIYVPKRTTTTIGQEN